MDRIREINGKYQVLLNQNYRTNPVIELTLGSLLADEYLKDYQVLEFNTMQEAMDLAFSLPMVDFNKIHSDCIDCFKGLNNIIYSSLKGIIKEYHPYLLSPNEIKNAIFDRVINKGRRFNLFNFNDVIAFDIIVSYSLEFSKIIDLLLMNKKLRIIKKVITKTHTKLIGLTQNNITYEIRLWTNEVRNMMIWIYKNNKNPYDYVDEINSIIARENENKALIV